MPFVSSALGAWTNIPSLSSNPSKSQFASYELYFSDSEYEVPYYLNHFAQVANSVVETTFTSNGVTYPRGFLNIKVNRNPNDNTPNNARIMEMQMVLAYFYTANRPWNIYRNSPHVKARLEAMLTRWVEMQNSTTGLFTEYSATDWGLAPTSFGAMAVAQSLDLIKDSGLSIDSTVFDNARASLRKAILAVFTNSIATGTAKGYSNQFSGAFHAALIYLENWSDTEMDAALVSAVSRAASEDQSPAGFYYEAYGPDFGYSNVHERNLRIALTRMRNRTNDLMPPINQDEAEWSSWLGHNLLLQPGLTTNTFVINAGINTRTSTAYQEVESRPLSEFTPLSRAFSYTDVEFTNAVKAKTDGLATTPTYGTLATNNAYSYQPGFVFEALQKTETWHPTPTERSAAINTLPYYAATRFNRILHDTKPLTVTAVRRPGYYALFNSGSAIVANQCKLGLGMIWNPSYGAALQAVSGTSNTLSSSWGTIRSGATLPYEHSAITTTLKLDGTTISPSAGINNLADGTITATYSLSSGGTNYGSKTLTFGENSITVDISHTGAFTERIPLLSTPDVTATLSNNRLVFKRTNNATMTLRIINSGPTVATNALETILSNALLRRPVTVSATNSLSYELMVSSDPFRAGPLGSPVSESYSPANSSPDEKETITYNLVLTNLLGASTTSAFKATLQSSGGITPVTTNRTYGAIAAGGSGSQPFSFIVNTNFGSVIDLTLVLSDGSTSYGTVTYSALVGGMNSLTNAWEAFDGVTPPSLPTGWTSSVPTGTANGWKTINSTPQAGLNAVFATPSSSASEQRLDSSTFTVPSNAQSAEIQFQHRWNMEGDSSSSYDGGVLEMSINGGSYQDVLATGAAFLSGGYGSVAISTGYSNPLAGRSAWSGSNDSAYTLTRVLLPASAIGKTAKLRFRLGCDSSVIPSNPIWKIDTLQLVYQTNNWIHPAEITSISPATVTVGSPYSHQFTATGSPASTFMLANGSLPAGLTLSTNGLLSGSVSNTFSPLS
ncbi:MAG: hypothetical protein EBV83_07310, partial [Verrucomicrobia bacterium]|nr:hypothetical protein [Verrucomicrobiota bacterium]